MIREKRHPTLETPLIVLLKLAGEQCNINCLYCYERRKPYEGSDRFDRKLTEEALKSLSGHPIRLILHGGEPLLVGKSRMAEILQAINASSADIRGVQIQTNGLLLDADWIKLFDDHVPHLEWGVSYDGPGQANSYRRDHADRETHVGAVRAIKLLAEHGRKPGIISVINAAHRDLSPEQYMDGFHQLREEISALSLVPCYDFAAKPRIWNSKSGARIMQLMGPSGPQWAIGPEFYGEYLVSTMRAWVGSGDWRHYSLEPIVSIIGNMTGKTQIARSTNFSFTDESHVVTVYPNGQIGPNDRLDEAMVGMTDLSSDPASLDRLLEQTRNSYEIEWRQLLDRCTGCSYWQICRGGELHERREMRKADREDEFCASRMKIIDATRSEIGE